MKESPFRFIHNFTRFLSASIDKNMVATITPIASRTFFEDIFSSDYSVGANDVGYFKFDIANKFDSLDESASTFKNDYLNILMDFKAHFLEAYSTLTLDTTPIKLMQVPTFIGGVNYIFTITDDEGNIKHHEFKIMFTQKADGYISSAYVFIGGK